MAKINLNYGNLREYPFPLIGRKANEFEARTGIKLIRLGIGDVTEPLVPVVIEALHKAVDKLARVETFSGYGAEQGNVSLRKAHDL